MALLRNSSKAFICGGSLIKKNFVITAAHCIENEKKLFVNLGVYDQFCHPSNCTEVEEYTVAEKFTYNVNGIRSDLGLVKLDRSVIYKAHIRPICIILDNRVRPWPIPSFTAFGWGKTQSGEASQFLRSITLHLRNAKEECEPWIKPMPKKNFCAGTKVGDTCSGDSGGPLNAHVRHNGKTIYAQFGVVSFGYTSCNFNAYYVNVMEHKLWITEIAYLNKKNYFWNLLKNSVKNKREVSIP
ncbi:serine protease grass-like [Drosophila takahashii]|uniref:serine protease grass-like n=1 Tax=Drosophila takahashii TaxID=29030 RepID=UPI003898DE06